MLKWIELIWSGNLPLATRVYDSLKRVNDSLRISRDTNLSEMTNAPQE